MSKLIKLLRKPPKTKIPCSSCGGQGFFITGAISTRTCSKCEGTQSPWNWKTNYSRFAIKVRKLVIEEYLAKTQEGR